MRVPNVASADFVRDGLGEWTREQRGKGVFQRSIQALMDLNAVGFGVEGSGLSLDLVYNPGGGFLPPSQEELEAAYKVQNEQQLSRRVCVWRW